MKNTNRLIFALLAAVALLFAAACSSDSDDTITDNTIIGDTIIGDTITASGLAGSTWQGIWDGDSLITFEFESDGEVTIRSSVRSVSGSYSVSDSTVAIYCESELGPFPKQFTLTYSLSTGQLVYSENNSGFRLTFTKKV